MFGDGYLCNMLYYILMGENDLSIFMFICNKNWKVTGSNHTRCLVRLMNSTHYEAPGDLCIEIVQIQ